MRPSVCVIFLLSPHILAISLEQRRIMDQLEESLKILCPGVDICSNSTPAKNVIFDKVLTSCCKSCSCAPDCKAGTCCFNDTEASGRLESKCLYPMAYERNFMPTMQKYYIVDSPPEGGCTSIDQSCNATLTYVWGDILPVISKATNLIYKTPQCAKCHGLLKIEYERWDSEFVCYKPPDYMNHFGFFNTLLRTQEFSEYCAMAFVYRSKEAYTGDERCYFDQDLSSDCKPDFDVPAELNMTRSEIEYACKNGPRIPFSTRNSAFIFYNVYCYICIDGNLGEKLFCGVDDSQIRNLDSGALTTLLKTEVIENTMTTAHSVDDEESVPRACLNETEAIRRQISNSSRCREILCPLGQIRDRKGACVIFSQNWSGVRFVIMIKIHFKDKSRVESMHFQDISDSLLETLNLPFSWVNNGAFAVSACDDLESQVSDYTLSFIIDASAPYDDLIMTVIKITDRSWMFERNANQIDFTVSIEKFTNFEMSSSAPATLSPVIPFSDSLNITKPCYQILKLKQAFSNLEEISVSKLFLCEQVALMPNEYSAFQESYHIVLSYRDRFFFAGEFTMDLDENGQTVTIICLEDSGLKKVTKNDMILQNRGHIPGLIVKTAILLFFFLFNSVIM